MWRKVKGQKTWACWQQQSCACWAWNRVNSSGRFCSCRLTVQWMYRHYIQSGAGSAQNCSLLVQVLCHVNTSLLFPEPALPCSCFQAVSELISPDGPSWLCIDPLGCFCAVLHVPGDFISLAGNLDPSLLCAEQLTSMVKKTSRIWSSGGSMVQRHQSANES